MVCAALPKKPVVASTAVTINGPTEPAVRPMDMVLETVGTARGDCGCHCEEHTCCGKVLDEDVVVRLRQKQILVSIKLGKGHCKEAAYTVNWVMDGHKIAAMLASFPCIHCTADSRG